MLTALLFILAQSQEPNSEVWTRPPRVERIQRVGGRSGPLFAFFEAFPIGGAGTTTACSTTAPTGAKGEPLTFTRASTGTCTSTASGGLATTGIANGDLVVLSSNVARVEYDSAGTLGLLVEAARTNNALRSEELDNAAWSNVTTIVAAPTLNGANAATAPDGTVTVEDYTFPATAVGEQSIRLSSIIPTACNSAACTFTMYVRGVSASGTTDLCAWDTVAPVCSACAFTNTSWTRCSLTSTRSGNVAIGIGNSTLWNGGTARSSVRVYAWGADAELGAYATSYIPTTSAAVTRAAESATFPGATLPANPYSLAVSLYPPNATTTGDLFYGNTATTGVGFFFVGGLLRAQNCNGTCANLSPAYAPTALTTTRLATSSTGGNQQTFVNGSSIAGPTATAAAVTPWATATGIGPGIGPGDAIISRVCLDGSPTRCR